MKKIIETSDKLVKNTSTDFIRYLAGTINWKNRLIAIKGARGTGKTTLMLQHIKQNFTPGKEVVYISLDDLYFSTNNLTGFTDEFVKDGGKFLFIDEVHKYSNWSQEIKNIYDQYPGLHIVFTGSSLLEIYKGFGDLSRRAVSYDLHGLSFREFVDMEMNINLPVLTLKEIITDHRVIAGDISGRIIPIAELKKYMTYGYYPYFKDGIEEYDQKLLNIINLIIESDLPAICSIEFSSILKLKKLLWFLANSVPYSPNIQKLSDQIETTRPTALQYIDYLRRSALLNLLRPAGQGYSYLSKPEKIFLHNTNLMYAIAPGTINIGNLRETFFFNQLNTTCSVSSAKKGDFTVNEEYVFEIGGKNKDFSQIRNVENSFLVIDILETGMNNRIPLWIFGLMY